MVPPTQQAKAQRVAEAFSVLGEYFSNLDVDAVEAECQKTSGGKAPLVAALLHAFDAPDAAGHCSARAAAAPHEPGLPPPGPGAATKKVRKGLGFGDLREPRDIAFYESTRSSINGLLTEGSVDSILRWVPGDTAKGASVILGLVLQDALACGVGVTAFTTDKFSPLAFSSEVKLYLSGSKSQFIQGPNRDPRFRPGNTQVTNIYRRK
jgi:hypothetical protein